jgi:hypothetical protein
MLPGLFAGETPKFYPDDPIQADPRPLPVGKIPKVDIYDLYDYFFRSVQQKPRDSGPARGVNTLGEVPDNAWFTARHSRRRMTREELQRGPGNQHTPQPPFVIVGAKTEGITPGFRMKDAAGRLYFVKPDPASNPELSTAADVMGSKFFYAIGYNTPENYIVRIGKKDLSVDKNARLCLGNRLSRRMTAGDLDEILATSARRPDGSIRVVASLAIPNGVGPFRYEGTRSDDPNDLVPHQDRRDLRGLHVFCSWLNHTDAKADNSFNAIVKEDGVAFLRHYLMDFGSAFGSDGDRAKDARFGNEYQIPSAGQALRQLAGLSLYSPGWERARYAKLKSVGRIEAAVFDPEKWKPNYPNPAFLSRRPDDEYWAAKIVLSFTDEDIRALVESGQFSDPRAVEYLTQKLIERRDKIGSLYFSKVLPLDNFEVRNGELGFEDLAVRYGFRPALQYQISWAEFDNARGTIAPIPASGSFRLPQQFESMQDGGYLAARIEAPAESRKSVTVFLRKKGPAAEVVGIERTWK